MNKDKMFDCQQMLVYSYMQKFSEETRSSLLLLVENIFQKGRFRICANAEVLCYQVGSQCVSENQLRSKHSAAYLSLGNITENTGQLHIYLIYSNTWDITELADKFLNDYTIIMMIVTNNYLLGYGISEQQLNDGLKVNILLKAIILYNCRITINMTNIISSYVEDNNEVQTLEIAKCFIDSLQLNVSSLTHIAIVDITFTAVMIDELADLIKRNSSLEFVNLARNNLQSFAGKILEALTHVFNLNVLQLSSNNMASNLSECLAGVIKSNPCLEQLALANNDLKSSAVVVLQALQGLTKLKMLDLSSNNMTSTVSEDLAGVIKSNPCLEQLWLANNDLKSSAVVVLQALQGLTKLEMLDLSSNNMTSTVSEDLAGVIKSNPCLEQLWLANNDLESSAAVVLQALQDVTKLNTKLKILNLDNINMDSEVSEDLAGVIKSNPDLEQLGLANNSLESSAVVVFQALQDVTKLKILDLDNNNMTSEVSKDLAGVIKSNPCLEQLWLANNNLESSAVFVLQALQVVTNFKKLNLSNNNITSEASEDLAGVIKSNPCLEQLWLANNDLESSEDVVLQVLQDITKLKILDLDNINVTSEVSEDLAGVIKNNPGLEQLGIANNNLESSAVVVFQALQDVTKLKILNLDNINMTSEVS